MAIFDRRRVPAPEVSIPPIYEPLVGAVDQQEAGPSRRDRTNDEARPIFLKTGLINQANGSGYIESGGVKIACSVYGPRPKLPPYTPQGTLNLEVKFAPFASDPRRAPLRDTEPIPLSVLLTQSLIPTLQLHLLPKSSIDVYLLVLESDTPTNVLSAGLTVASAAIADAGIAMNGLGVGSVVASSSLSSSGSDLAKPSSASLLLLDPSEDEEKASESKVLVGSMPALGRITNLFFTGEAGINEACDMIEKAITSSRDTHTVLAQSLLEGAAERGIGAETATT
ncbi:exosome complex component MTR3 [Kwoniella heveanensis BCC8398]|uniref:Exosome complex component MTR3 n=1 Tax=Kwoniella heveanensis BCC8398 TaxID=1296120 RepID=A0A1B9GS96_9TREE|nr:exosome complex component MTR3 [Kwoniella heveanensis BCC8398]